ncbi:MAG: phenylalanine--tRNA ligase subunit beta [Oscillospiraceae bacterium]|jgi:phenylalanyl-tRNA synthetase beta chain|nr:phenylalanine--tRNA ligase subunit beta [Oscillospiraceae bacterium]
MLISMNWISDFTDLSGLDIDNLIHRFTLSTAEVEEVMHIGGDIKNVVAARIESIENHPNSKKLHLLKVNAGDEILDCVCGAPNVREGMIVAFAKIGGSVHGGMEIKRASIAGFESCGMCCSEAELGISADHSGLMEITDDIPLGTDIKKVYDIDDIVFEVDNKSLTNRPDLWGHYGIAREFAVLSGRPLLPLDKADKKKYKNLPEVEIDIKDKVNCYRYSSVKVENVTAKVSPVNMRIRLYYCGTRAINLLADLTNYIMLELAQPMHAFDLRKVGKVEVQRFPEPFEFETLDGQKRRIDPDTLMITTDDKPVAIAGIMGGLASEIEDDTDSLLLESANFDAVSTRKSSSRLGLRTDASMRYEKTLDPEMTVDAVERYIRLLTDIDKGARVISKISDSYVRKYKKITLTFDKKYVDRYTGIKISKAMIEKTLRALGFGLEIDKNEFTVTVPSYRSTKDVTIKADIIEEITRIYGYDNFEVKTTLSPLYPVRSTNNRVDDYDIKNLLADSFKLHEVHSYIWCDARRYKEIGISTPENVKLINSMSPDHIVLRNNIVPTLLLMAAENKSFAGDYGIFEIARVVEGLKEDGMCNERKKLGIVLFSKTKSEKQLYTELRGIVDAAVTVVKGEKAVFSFADCTPFEWQHPKNTADISVCGEKIGVMTAIHPSVGAKIDKKAAIVALQIDMDMLSSFGKKPSEYAETSKFPTMEIDLSLMLSKERTYSEIEGAVAAANCPLLKRIVPVDVYEAEELGDYRSVTVRLTFSSYEKTLSGEEVNAEVAKILEKLAESGINMK